MEQFDRANHVYRPGEASDPVGLNHIARVSMIDRFGGIVACSDASEYSPGLGLLR
jgi:hypothetical protein